MSVAVIVTDLGNLALVGPAAAVCGLWMAWRWGADAARRFLWPVTVGLAATVALKLVSRLIANSSTAMPFGLSAGAPSGHVEMVAGVYGGLALALLRRHRALAGSLAAVLAAAILAGVAVTRVTLHAHTPADVAAGLLIGAACAVWIARGVAVPPATPVRHLVELLALLIGVAVLMQLSSWRIDSARII